MVGKLGMVGAVGNIIIMGGGYRHISLELGLTPAKRLLSLAWIRETSRTFVNN